MSENDPPGSPWAPPASPPGPPAPPPQPGQSWGTPPASPPQPPGAPASQSGPPAGAAGDGGGSKFAIGVIVGLLFGLVVGIIGAAVVVFLVASDSEDPSAPLQIDGPDFGQNDAAPPDPATTREAPAPVGTAVALGNGWEVTVTGFDGDADDEMAAVDFNEPAPDGDQYVLVELQLDYVDGAEESQSPFFGMDLSVVGSENVARSETDTVCTAPEPALDNLSDVFRGGSVTGKVCFEVAQGESESLVLIAEPSMSFDAVPSYFELG